MEKKRAAKVRTPLHVLVEGAANDLHLLLAREAHEVDGVARDTDGELGVLLGVLHGILQSLAREHVHVEVVRALVEVAVEERGEVGHAVLVRLAESCLRGREEKGW